MILASLFEFVKGLVVPSWYNYVPQFFLPFGIATLPMLTVVKFVIYKTIFAVSHIGPLFTATHGFWLDLYDNVSHTTWDNAEFLIVTLVAYAMYRLVKSHQFPSSEEPVKLRENVTRPHQK